MVNHPNRSKRTRQETEMAATLILEGADLSAMFGIDPAHTPIEILCGKCHGRGNFVGYTGRVVGKCFACEGTGLSAKAQGLPEPAAEISVEAIATAFASARAKGIKTPKLRLDTLVFCRAPD